MIKFEFDLPEKVSTNAIYAGIHWGKKKKLADLYHDYMIQFRKTKVPDELYPVEIAYVFEFKSKPLDTTNCTYMAKLMEDGLVKHGILKGDSPEYVQGTHIYSSKGKRDKVLLMIS